MNPRDSQPWRHERVTTSTTMRDALEAAIRKKTGLPEDHDLSGILSASGLKKVAPVRAPKARKDR